MVKTLEISYTPSSLIIPSYPFLSLERNKPLALSVLKNYTIPSLSFFLHHPFH